MPPNFNDMSGPGPVNIVDGPKENSPNGGAPVSRSSVGAGLKATRSLTTLMAHMMIGIVVGVSLLFAFRSGTLPLGATNLHVVLCLIGFQFLMAEAILCLAPDSWLSTLNLKHQRWIHWVLQVVGSVLGLVGCFIKYADKNVNWNTLHGQFALVSMIFTALSLVNGLTSMYAYSLRRCIPGILSRLTHIAFGVIALGAASISLIYGFDKNFFRNWATGPFTDTLIVMTGALTVIVIINPCITFYQKFAASVRN